jgi:class 3 adenylate cyclase
MSNKNIKILIVDDDPNMLDLLEVVIKSGGYTVVTAADGAEALRKYEAEPSMNLIISDMNMQEMSGNDLVKKIREKKSDVPIIILTGNEEMSTAMEILKNGADDYVLKGENTRHAIIISVKKNLERYNLIKQNAQLLADLERKNEELHKQADLLSEVNRTLEKRVEEEVAKVERLDKLKRFFSPQLAEMIVSGGADDPLKSHRREITVVFLDIRNFTSLAENYEPEEVMSVLREYHAAMGQIVMEHQGTLERFTGDGMMIFFNDPVVVPNPVERAVRMSVAMRKRFAELQVNWHKMGYDISLGIGIAQGFATIGAIGFEGRIDYGAIGSVTNLSARLCGAAEGSQILVSKRCLAKEDGLVEAELIGDMELKGFYKAVTVYNILKLKEAMP